MESSNDRDRTVERLLRQSIDRPSASSAMGDCVDGETLAAWTGGSLRPAEASVVERHVSECARCQAMLATFARTAPIVPVAEPLWKRWQVRWLVPIATAATVVAIWVALPRDRLVPQTSEIAQEADDRQQKSDQPPVAPLPAPAEPPPSPSIEGFRANRDAAGKVGSQTGAALEAKPTQPGANTLARGSDAVAQKTLNQRVSEDANAKRERQDRLAAAAPPPAPSPAAAPAPVPPALMDTVRPQTPAANQARPEQKVREESAATEFESALVEIVSPDRTHRWRVAVGGIDYSADAGKKWQRVTIRPPAELTIGDSPAPRVVWLVGPEGAIYVTSKGSEFVRVPFVERLDLVSVDAVDDRQATVTASDGRSFRTTDGGATWTRPPL